MRVLGRAAAWVLYHGEAVPMSYKTQTRTVATAVFTTAGNVPANPTTTTLTRTGPQGTVVFHFGVDAEITNPEVGTFRHEHTPPRGEGNWRYEWLGTGVVDAIAVTTIHMVDL
jgi:hypothetical protein